MIPVYNGAEFIESCIGSVQESVASLCGPDREKIEILICDNWSTDGTPDLVNAATLDRNWRVIRPPKHFENRTANWDHAVRSASGTWVQMLHADDLMASNALTGRLGAVSSRRSASAVMLSARHRTFESGRAPSRLRPRWRRPAVVSGRVLARRVLPLHCPFVPFTLFRRSAFLEVGGFDLQWELVQDWDLWSRLLLVGDLLYDPHEAGWWRLHPLSHSYREQFAREQEAFVGTLSERVPGLKRSTHERARRVDAARGAVLLEVGDLRARNERTVKRAAQAAGMRMHLLRMLGSLRTVGAP